MFVAQVILLGRLVVSLDKARLKRQPGVKGCFALDGSDQDVSNRYLIHATRLRLRRVSPLSEREREEDQKSNWRNGEGQEIFQKKRIAMFRELVALEKQEDDFHSCVKR